MTSRLAARLATSDTGVEDVPAIVCQHVVTDLRLRAARVTIGAGEGQAVIADVGSVDSADSGRFELRHRGAMVGVLEVSPRQGEQRLDERDVVVLRGVADQAAPAVAAVQLHHALQRSREALVAAREAERRGLRHDLHDGLGATLAGLRLQLETARDLSEHATVVSLLDAATGGIAQAVAEVRTLCEGLRPPGIDDLGLSRALVALADRIAHPGLHVDVDIQPDLDLDPAIEVALYRIAAEALANVARHSGAASAALDVHVGSHVELVVRDDGVGMAGTTVEPGSGLGLPSMRQRAEEVGGRLTLGTAAGGGVEVRAFLPRTLEGAA
jgi:signal transduction histidine kinase